MNESPWAEPYRIPEPPRRRRFGLGLVAGLTVLVLAIIGGEVAVMRARSGTPHATTATPTSTTLPTGSTPTSSLSQPPTERFLLGPVGASSELTADRGTIVFSDDFSDPTSGWTTAPLPSGTTFAYGVGGYVVTAKGALHHFSFAPYVDPVQQLSQSVSATEPATPGASGAGGVGVVCRRGTGSSQLQYEFLVFSDRRWYVERRDGAAEGSVPTVLKQGSLSAGPGSTPVEVDGMCASETDGRTTRLALFVNGRKVADLANVASTFLDLGWRGGIDVASGANPSTFTVGHFAERDLAL